MTDDTQTPEEQMLATHEFAAKALEEIVRRGVEDGYSPELMHVAFCVTSIGFLSNSFGSARTKELLQQLIAQVDSLPEAGTH